MKQGDVTTQDQAVILPHSFSGSTSRDISLATGTQVVTGLGFKPAAIIFIAADPNTSKASWGFTSGLTEGSIHIKNNVGADAHIVGGTAIEITQAAATVYTGTMSSMDTDGFTISWLKEGLPTGTISIRFLAFK